MTMSDEHPHPWTTDPTWQESVAAWFHDAERGIGGWLRWGVHPALGFGRFNVFVFADDGLRFRRVDERVPIEVGVEPPAELRVARCIADVDANGRPRLRWDEPECAGSLAFEGFYPPQGWGSSQAASEIDAAVNAGHLECSGLLRGALRLDDRELQIEALAHRDRSWGPRHLEAVHTHRMMSGTTGPELSFAATQLQLVDGTVHAAGFLARDGVVEELADAEILATLHLDGVSVASGRCRAVLDDGREVVIDAETIDGQLTPFDDYLTTDHVARARSDDLVGFCDVEITNNPRAGSAMPRFVQYAADGDGLSRRPPPPR